MNAVIKDGHVWIVEADYDMLKKVNDLLTFEVPGAEHSDKFRRGVWDGMIGFMNWQHKRFATGLLYYVEKKIGEKILITDDDRQHKEMSFIPFKVKNAEGEEYDLYDFQKAAIEKLLVDNCGLVGVATNGGKTAVISGLLLAAKEAGLTVCILTHMEALLWQIRTEVERNTRISIGAITAKEKSLNDRTIMMVQTVSNMLGRVDDGKAKPIDEQVYAFLSSVDMIICDEVHHAQAMTWTRILGMNTASMRFGCSGTIPDEESIDGISIRAVFGSQVVDIRNAELIDRGISAVPLINMIEYHTDVETREFKDFTKKLREDCMKFRPSGNIGRDGKETLERYFSVPTYTNKVKQAVMDLAVRENFTFWKTIAHLVNRHKGQSIIIFVDWVDFCEDLADYLGVQYLHGKNVEQRERILEDFEAGKINCLVVTSVLDEGISINLIKVLILATVGSSKRQFKQRLGRGLRKKAEDNTLTVYDFIRYGHKYLLGASKKRRSLWLDEGFEVSVIEDFKEFLKC